MSKYLIVEAVFNDLVNKDGTHAEVHETESLDEALEKRSTLMSTTGKHYYLSLVLD